VLAAKTIMAAAVGLVVGLTATGIAGGALVAAIGRDFPPLGADQLTGIVVGSVAAASVLAVAAGTVIRNPVEALAAATGMLFVPPPLAVLLRPAPVCLDAKRRRRRPGRPATAQPDLLSQSAGASCWWPTRPSRWSAPPRSAGATWTEGR
jgi:hypothetical protein